MKTAAAIIIKEEANLFEASFHPALSGSPNITVQEVFKIVNRVRKETIEECAKRAEADVDTDKPLGEGMGYGYSVDKNSILSLIDEFKQIDELK